LTGGRRGVDSLARKKRAKEPKKFGKEGKCSPEREKGSGLEARKSSSMGKKKGEEDLVKLGGEMKLQGVLRRGKGDGTPPFGEKRRRSPVEEKESVASKRLGS